MNGQTPGNLNADARAILLLCGYFDASACDEKPLGAGEYHRLAVWLHQRALRPASLLELEGWRRLEDGDAPVESERVRRLMSRGGEMALALERWLNKGLWVLCRSDAAYPGRLKSELKAKTPPILYGAGPLELLGEVGLGVVGSRHAPEPSLGVARILGCAAARCGVPLVSGGAAGVDMAAAEAALDEGGRAVLVLGDSLLRRACRKPERDYLREGRLVLLSPCSPESRFSVGAAMGRNKIVYALADTVVVISASVGKGGTWAGATEALKLWPNDRVFVWVADGAPEGNRKLVEKGALPVAAADEADLVAFVRARVAPGRPSGRPRPAVCEAGERAPVTAAEPPAERLFAAVRRELLAALQEPVTASKLAKGLRLEPSQLRVWLERLLHEGAIEQRRCGRTTLWCAKQPNLFGETEGSAATEDG
ncbi:MAG: DNA-processing protein DprA [Kiritimatiellae bacterium]|nr:DNA-processing protein DprA [Kiritimatiellia bacterium]